MRKKILVIEDHEDTRDLIKEILSDHEVIGVPDLNAGTALLAAAKFDLILTDLTVPGADGPDDLLTKIKSVAPAGEIALISGAHDLPDIAARWNVGFILKPVSMAGLVELAERA